MIYYWQNISWDQWSLNPAVELLIYLLDYVGYSYYLQWQIEWQLPCASHVSRSSVTLKPHHLTSRLAFLIALMLLITFLQFITSPQNAVQTLPIQDHPSIAGIRSCSWDHCQFVHSGCQSGEEGNVGAIWVRWLDCCPVVHVFFFLFG